jgi:hypothetical protein
VPSPSERQHDAPDWVHDEKDVVEVKENANEKKNDGQEEIWMYRMNQLLRKN